MKAAVAAILVAMAAIVTALVSASSGHVATFENVVVTGSLTVLTPDGGLGMVAQSTRVQVYDYADKYGMLIVGDGPDAGDQSVRGLYIHNSGPGIEITNTNVAYDHRQYQIYENQGGVLEFNSALDNGLLPGTICQMDFYGGSSYFHCQGGVSFDQLYAASVVSTKELRMVPHPLNEFVGACQGWAEGFIAMDPSSRLSLCRLDGGSSNWAAMHHD